LQPEIRFRSRCENTGWSFDSKENEEKEGCDLFDCCD